MNYCNLAEKLQLPPEEVRLLFSNPESNYYNIKEKEWQEINSPNTIRIKRFDAPIKIPLVEEYDEYTNQITSLAWEELVDYVNGNPPVENILQAAFLIDILEKNCILLTEHLLKNFKKIKCAETLTLFTVTGKRNYSAKTSLEECNQSILFYLKLVVPRDAFIRV